jgi:hypothetical protein
VQRILGDHEVGDDIVDVELEMHRLALAASHEPHRAEHRMSYLVRGDVCDNKFNVSMYFSYSIHLFSTKR